MGSQYLLGHSLDIDDTAQPSHSCAVSQNGALEELLDKLIELLEHITYSGFRIDELDTETLDDEDELLDDELLDDKTLDDKTLDDELLELLTDDDELLKLLLDDDELPEHLTYNALIPCELDDELLDNEILELLLDDDELQNGTVAT